MYEFGIPSMTCGHCKGTVEKAIKAADPAFRKMFDPHPVPLFLACRQAIGPCGLDQHGARFSVSGFCNCPAPRSRSARRLRWYKPKPAHKMRGCWNRARSPISVKSVAEITRPTPRNACRALTSGASDQPSIAS